MEIKGNYLHLLLKRTKRQPPYHKNISLTHYPIQNQEYLNNIVNVWIKDNYRIIPDDTPDYRKESEPQIIEVPCRIIRYDAEDPWVAVYASTNYEFIVTDSSLHPSEYPLINPIQYNKDDQDIIGMYGRIQTGYINNNNMLETFNFPGVVVESAISEPAIDVIIGQYSRTTFVVYLSSEVWFDIEGNIITDPTMESKVKTIEVRKQLLEGKTPYGLN